MQMELGCPALPYRPYLYFINETGAVPSEGMAFDAEGGATVLAVLVAEPSYSFSEPVQWAMVTDMELQEKNKTFTDLHSGLFRGDTYREAFNVSEWCSLSTGEFSSSGELAQS